MLSFSDAVSTVRRLGLHIDDTRHRYAMLEQALHRVALRVVAFERFWGAKQSRRLLECEPLIESVLQRSDDEPSSSIVDDGSTIPHDFLQVVEDEPRDDIALLVNLVPDKFRSGCQLDTEHRDELLDDDVRFRVRLEANLHLLGFALPFLGSGCVLLGRVSGLGRHFDS